MGFQQDLKYAGRMLVKSPGVSAMAVTALALGIGATATMFSIVYAALMRGLPFEDGDRVVAVSRTNPELGINRQPAPVHDYADWAEQQRSFQSMAAYYSGTVNVTWSERPERFDGAFSTSGIFDVVGFRPYLGRSFGVADDAPGAPLTLVLSYQVWQDRFAADRDILGQVVKVNGEIAEIIGVMPAGFAFPDDQDVWVAMRADPLATKRGEGQYVTVVGMLRDGVSVDQAGAEFAGIAQRLALDHPDTNEGYGVRIDPFTDLAIGDEARGILLAMLGAVSLVLLIACANVANLLLARAAARVKEVGIRTALGASRWRVVSQMVAEALALALVGGVIGIGLTWVGVTLFDNAIQGTDPPFFLIFKVDGPIVAYVLAMSVVAAVVAGGIPALKASGMDVSGILKDESRGSSSFRIGRLSKVLVIGEIAMSMGMLVAAGLMTKSITTLRTLDYGFDTDEVFTARLGIFPTDFPDVDVRRRFFEDLRARLASVPGATSSSLGTVLPGVGSNRPRFGVEGEAYATDRDYPSAWEGQIDLDYFRTVGVDVSLGRDFEAADDANGVQVAVVNESFAKKYLTGGSPLGSRIRVGASESTEPWRTVVGVVPDIWMQGLGNPDATPEGFYVPIQQSDNRFMSILARGPADPMELTSAVREAVIAVNADTPIYFVETLRSRVKQNIWVYNVFGVLFMVFGGVALFLASIGLYAVMAFSVSRRTPEVGIRMAMGAEGRQVLSLILRQGLAQIGIGVVLGIGVAVVVGKGLTIVLFQVKPGDPQVFALVAAVLVVTGTLASVIPARRATRVDPLVALRSE
jgi:predicted permease